MDRYQVVIDLIKNNSDVVDFADYGEGIPESWIEIVEKRLNVIFPPSYVWWLKNYGGGRVYGDEIFSIYNLKFDNIPSGDIVYQNELDRKNKTPTEKH